MLFKRKREKCGGGQRRLEMPQWRGEQREVSSSMARGGFIVKVMFEERAERGEEVSHVLEEG